MDCCFIYLFYSSTYLSTISHWNRIMIIIFTVFLYCACLALNNVNSRTKKQQFMRIKDLYKLGTTVF